MKMGMGAASDPELSSDKNLRLREVKCLFQGHTATHHQMMKEGAPRTADRDRQIYPAAERGAVNVMSSNPSALALLWSRQLSSAEKITGLITFSLGGICQKAETAGFGGEAGRRCDKTHRPPANWAQIKALLLAV